jgi:hypothetical protein
MSGSQLTSAASVYLAATGTLPLPDDPSGLDPGCSGSRTCRVQPARFHVARIHSCMLLSPSLWCNIHLFEASNDAHVAWVTCDQRRCTLLTCTRRAASSAHESWISMVEPGAAETCADEWPTCSWSTNSCAYLPLPCTKPRLVQPLLMHKAPTVNL